MVAKSSAVGLAPEVETVALSAAGESETRFLTGLADGKRTETRQGNGGQ
jgi:hypothetical protein